MPRFRGRRLWFVSFAAFFLLGAGWAIATPYDGSPDEVDHVVRAAGIARGQIIAGSVPGRLDLGVQRVPAGLIHRHTCWQFHKDISAACAKHVEPSGDTTLVATASTAGRYPPLYYLAVGWPMALWPSWTGVIVARLISAAISAALLAFASFAVVRWTNHRLLPAGILVAVTPITLQLAGSINPNGTEIAAGTALFAALIPLVLDRDGSHRRSALLLATGAAISLVLIRAFGPLWLAIAVTIVTIPSSRSQIAALLRLKGVRVSLAAIGLSNVAAVAWMGNQHTGSIGSVNLPIHLSVAQALWTEVVDRSGDYATQMIGVLSWLDTPLPGLAYLAWFMAFGLLFLTALSVGGAVQRWRLLALSVAVFAVPILGDTLNANTYGLVAQARYVLPVAVGVPLLAAWIISDHRALSVEHTTALSRVLGLVLVPIHLAALWYTMIRWQVGLRPLGHFTVDPFALLVGKGEWVPPLGAVAPLALVLLGSGFLLAYVWWAPAIPVTVETWSDDAQIDVHGDVRDDDVELARLGRTTLKSPSAGRYRMVTFRK